MRIPESAIKRIATDGAVAMAARDVFVQQLTDALPEARVIQRINDDHTARVITFELLSEEH